MRVLLAAAVADSSRSSEDTMFSILDMDEQGACTILFASPAVQTLLGYTPEEYIALGCVLRDGSQQLAALGKLCR